MIYAIRAGDLPFVKIGTSWGGYAGAGGRLDALQAGCPIELRLLGIIDGDRRAEYELHQRFAAQRERGEWFRIEGPVAQWLADNHLSGIDGI